MDMHKSILEAYADGSPLKLIAESFNVSEIYIKEFLIKYKEDSRYKKSFTEEFKRLIAERDMSGVARNAITSELGLNVNTVKKACEAYGQSVKGRATSDNLYTQIDGDFNIKVCPSCNSKRNNLVEENTTFCLDCDLEHEYYDGYVLKINFEYLEE